MLHADRDLLPAAVHGILRYDGAALLTRPRVHEDPYRFDITRHRGKPGEAHTAFSHGMHYCLGAALARQEGEVAFDALLSTYPDLSLVPGRPPRRQVVPGALRLTELPVRL